MSVKKYDLIVIGGGSAGVRSARWAAARGIQTLLVEKSKLGGTCVVRGCVPKKIMVMAAQHADEQVLQCSFGWEDRLAKFSWAKLKQARDQEVDRLVSIYKNLLETSKVHLISGHAEFLSPERVRVNDEEFEFNHLIIASGGRPVKPDIIGADLASTSDEFFAWSEQPKRVCVVGGGYIGLELAGVLNAIGSDTHLICRSSQVLSGFDEKVRAFAKAEIEKKGICFHLETQVTKIERINGSYVCHLNNQKSMEVDQVLMATGRIPNIEGLGLEKAQVDCFETGRIRTNAHFQTSNPNVYAIGDVSNSVQLTPVALHEAMWLVQHLYGGEPQSPFSYEAIPTAVFSQPEIATCGLTEEQVRDRGMRAKIFESEFYSMKQVIGGRKEKSLIKMIVCASSDQVLGVHLVGAQSAEILQGFAIAIKCRLKKSDLDQVVGIHPTVAEELVTLRSFQTI